jgi:hypothetical protein
MTSPKIICGGQTGADRAALDWAIFHDISHGGWCPKGRKAEDGPVAGHYALKETTSARYPQAHPVDCAGLRRGGWVVQERVDAGRLLRPNRYSELCPRHYAD